MLVASMTLNFIKKFVESTFGCRIFRHSLPRGTDLCVDVKRLGAPYYLNQIVDVGANVGQTAIMFAREFPNAKIIAFEPISSTFEELAYNTRNIPNVECVRLALGSKPAKHEVHFKSISRVNTIVPELNRPEADFLGSETIQVETLDRFCEERNLRFVDLLKIDTEGFDLEVIRGADRLISNKQVRFILAEVGFDRSNMQHVPLEDIMRHLLDRGFLLFGIYEQTNSFSGEPFLLYCNALFINREAMTSQRLGLDAR